MTLRDRIEEELKWIELMQEAGRDHDEIRAAEINVQAMAIAEHLEDAVAKRLEDAFISTVRVTTAEHWREEGERWEAVEAEYRTRLDSRIERTNASIIAKLKWLILLVLLIPPVIGLGALLLL